MKQFLLLIIFVFSLLSAHAQTDTVSFPRQVAQKGTSVNSGETNINIYPVPVRDNSFTIKSDKEISSIKISNIIGQDIYRVKYNSPQQLAKIVLDNPVRGMYLVAIIFSDNTRVVKKIMIESSF